MPQEDRRIRRTRNMLNTSLAALIEEKEYEDITVQEITNRADVGHRTFYRHYADKDELLVDVMKDTFTGFRELLVLPSFAAFSDEELGDTPKNNGRKLFEYVQKNQRLFTVIFEQRPAVYQSMLALAREKTIEILHNMADETGSPVPYSILAHHITISTIEMMKFWLKEGQPYSPEVMGGYLVQMVLKPTRQLFSEGR